MYNRNINRLSAVIQSPIAPRSTNVLWDDLVSNTLKVYRKGVWTVIGGAGGGGSSDSYWGYDEENNTVFITGYDKVQINCDLVVNGNISSENWNDMWELSEDGTQIFTTKQVLIKNNLIVEGDTSSGGEGSDTPTSGTVTGIKVNGVTYEPTAGIVTIPDYPTSLNWESISGKPSFATVATSGSYTDLSNKPTIASLMGSSAIGGTSAFLYWTGSVWATKSLGDRAFDSTAYQPLSTAINIGNIGSQSVNYATSAGSATKLATARTIWGQSFDGTGNVSGAMSGVTNINSAIYINSSGNVGIGTTTPQYKLDVNGDSRISGNLIVSGDVASA